MSWIGVVGHTLEFSGKIVQSASFEEWARSKGREIIEKTAQERTIRWFGKQRAARKDLWRDLQLITKQPALYAALSDLAKGYLATLIHIANAFEDNQFTADKHT